MRIESSQYKRFLRHECGDSEYRNKIFSSLSESDMVFTQKQILKNIPNASNRFEDYLIAFSDDDLEMLFECFESISTDESLNAMKKQYFKDIISHEFLATKILENIIQNAERYGNSLERLDFTADHVEKLKTAFASGDYRNLSSSKLGFTYPNYYDIGYFCSDAKNTVVLNFVVDKLEEVVESDMCLQSAINDYLHPSKDRVSRIFTTKEGIITPINSAGSYLQPVHDYDWITGIDYNPNM